MTETPEQSDAKDREPLPTKPDPRLVYIFPPDPGPLSFRERLLFVGMLALIVVGFVLALVLR